MYSGVRPPKTPPEPMPTLEDTLKQYPFPDFEAHIAKGVVSFEEVASAFFASIDARLDSKGPPGYRFAYAQYYQRLRDAFEKTRGINEIYWGTIETGCASVLTADDNIFDVAPGPEEGTLDLYQIMWDCEKLVIEARGNLVGTKKTVAMKRLFEIITNVMATLAEPGRQIGGALLVSPQAKPLPPPPIPPPGTSAKSVPTTPASGPPKPAGVIPEVVIGFFKNQVQEVQNYYHRMATRIGLTYYLAGTALGVTVTGLLIALLLVSRSSITSSSTSVDALAAFISGAAGGAVGVMVRLFDPERSVDYDAGKKLIVVGGFFRPIVGGILGSAFFAAVFSGLIPLTVPTDSTRALAYYSFVAFIGGLAERWAQDTLVQSGEGIFGIAGKAKGAKKGPGANDSAGASPIS